MYDFATLSHADFQELVHDLAERYLGVRLESFGAGPDGGIDLRHVTDSGRTTVVQAKHYRDFRKLTSVIKTSELAKIAKLRPSRYVLATSVSLTPDRKKRLFTLLSRWVQSDADILGREDLNALLRENPDVERANVKLWLGNAAVLDKLINSRIYNLSEVEIHEITESLKYYVRNASMNHAIDILMRNHCVVITGIPGIGKTTLANVLALYLLRSGYGEMVYVSGDISDAFRMLNPEKSQVFLYDDFLGSNFLRALLPKNEDKRLLSFMRAARESPNHALIMTTREYILQQALGTYEALGQSRDLRSAEYVLDLGPYVRPIRARILYNHLYHSDVPLAHLQHFVSQKVYRSVVDHPNYSPRIIATLTREHRGWMTLPPADFTREFLEHFDKPRSIWRHAFENQISTLCQSILLVLCSCGSPFLLSDLREATFRYVSPQDRHTGGALDSVQFTRAIREIDGTFVRSEADSNGSVALDFHNPSVRDFLIDHLANNPTVLERILTTATFGNQLFTLFRPSHGHVSSYDRRIAASANLDALRRSIVIRSALALPRVELLRINYVGGTTRWANWYGHQMRKIRVLIECYDVDTDAEIRSLVIGALSPSVLPPQDVIERSDYIFVLKSIAKFIEDQMHMRIAELFESSDAVYHLSLMKTLREAIPATFTDFIERRGREYVESKVDEVVDSDLRSAEKDILHHNVDNLTGEVADVMQTFELEQGKYAERLGRLAQEHSDALAGVPSAEVSKPPESREPQNDDETVIDALFQSLISGRQSGA